MLTREQLLNEVYTLMTITLGPRSAYGNEITVARDESNRVVVAQPGGPSYVIAVMDGEPA